MANTTEIPPSEYSEFRESLHEQQEKIFGIGEIRRDCMHGLIEETVTSVNWLRDRR